MTALQTPAADAPASDWGRLAVSTPGWRWMPGMLTAHGRICGAGYLVSDDVDDTGQPYVDRTDSTDDWPELAPDPDDPATAGCFLALLGLSMPDWWVATTVREDGIHIVRASKWGHARVEGEGHTIGRACIAAAAALGRWPGGEA
jgi:hypothetical protein